MKRFRWTAGLASGVLTFAIAGAFAQAAEPRQGDLVPASGRLAGFTGGQLLGEELRQVFELPSDENPYAGNGDSCFAAGHRNKVLIAWTREVAPVCTVKPGTPIFAVSYFWECSNREAAPSFGGETEAGQRACALEQLRVNGVFHRILVSIDGRRPVDIYSDRYLAVSRQTTADLPDDNIFDLAAGELTFVAAGWVAMIRPLPPGTHRIRIAQVLTDGTSAVTGVNVKVVRRR